MVRGCPSQSDDKGQPSGLIKYQCTLVCLQWARTCFRELTLAVADTLPSPAPMGKPVSRWDGPLEYDVTRNSGPQSLLRERLHRSLDHDKP